VTAEAHRGRAERRPAGRALRACAAVVGGLTALAILTGTVWLLLLACLALAAVLVDALLPWPGACLHLGLVGPLRARAGDPVRLELVVVNAGTRRSRPGALRLRTPLLELPEAHVGSLEPEERVVVRLAGRAARRGAATSVDLELTKIGILGLLSWGSRRDLAVDLVVAPGAAPPWPVPEAATQERPGGARVVHPAGAEVHAMREWRPGDPSRHVHWRTSARRGRLVVTDRLEEMGGDLVLVVAPPVAGVAGPDPDWEELVSRLAATAIRPGRTHVLAALRGVPDLHASDPATVLDWCARLPGALDAVAGDAAAVWQRAVGLTGPGGAPVLVRTPAAARRTETP